MHGNSMIARLDEERVLDDRCDRVLQNNAGQRILVLACQPA